MAKLVYAAIASLDGFVADEQGNFDWAAPDEEVHAFVNDLERPIGTHLLGRRMYEVLRYWDTDDPVADRSAAMRDYRQIWQGSDKVVYSRTLEAVTTARTRLEREFAPDAVAELKANTDRDVAVGGPHLAAEAFRAGLVDECHLLLHPIAVGRGNRALPEDVVVKLELLAEHRFAGGVVHLHYRVI